MNVRERFANQMNRLCPCDMAQPATRAEVLAALKSFACAVQLSAAERAASPDEYTVRPLLSGPSGWSLVVVVLLPGQQTPPHDHESWGCAVTLHGIERNRCFGGACPDALYPLEERDVPPGDGYIFSEGQVHQTVGADPSGVTISLHVLVRGTHGAEQDCREGDQPGAH